MIVSAAAGTVEAQSFTRLVAAATPSMADMGSTMRRDDDVAVATVVVEGDVRA